MQIFITVNGDKTLRITDGEGAFLTFFVSKETAQILSVVVPESRRRQGAGKALLLASEKILAHKGVETIWADLSEEVEGAFELFESCGFKKQSEADILAVPIGMVMYSANVKNCLEMEKRYSNYAALSDLTIPQLDEVFGLLEEAGLNVSCYEMAHYNRDISTVVYDKGKRPVAALLCSEIGRDIHVNFLVSKAGVDPTYILMAMFGTAVALQKARAEYRYNRVTMAAYNAGVIDLLDRSLGVEVSFTVIGKGISMSKSIKDGYADASDFEYQKDKDDYQEDLWRREVKDFPYQKNIIFKSRWSRVKDS